VIRITVPRPVADALMPLDCPTCGSRGTHAATGSDAGPGIGFQPGPCPNCDGTLVLPPVLRLLVVEGERVREHCYCNPKPAPGETRHSPHCQIKRIMRPPADLVRAIEAGERIELNVGCEACRGSGSKMRLNTNTGMPVWGACPDCADGRVPVGSVRPVRVMPIEPWTASREPWPPGKKRSLDIVKLYVEAGPHGRVLAVSNGLGVGDITDVMRVYGPTESLVGKFAVEVEDAREGVVRSAQERAAEVIRCEVRRSRNIADDAAAALAAEGLLVDDNTAHRVALGRAVEAMRSSLTSGQLRQVIRRDVRQEWNDCLDAIYHEAGVEP
jgi:hypothetical protein